MPPAVHSIPAFAVVLACGLLAAQGVARAEPDDAAALFQQAEADDARRDYERALSEYERAVALLPSAPFVPKAQARARALRSHHEGDFVPLRILEAVRADRATADDPTALADLARQADGFPPGPVRAEARMLVAEAYLGRLRRPGDAVPLLEKVVADPSADPLIARLALDMLVTAHLDAERLDAASESVAGHAPLAEPNVVARVHTALRRRALRRVSVAVLVATAALAAIATFRAARRKEVARATGAVRRAWKVALGFMAYTALAGAALATAYEAGSSKPFFAFGAAALPVVLLARAWGAVGSTQTAARAARAVLCAAAVVAVAFLVLERIDAEYLKGFGL